MPKTKCCKFFFYWDKNRNLGYIFVKEKFLLDRFYLFVLLPRTMKVHMAIETFL